MKSRPEYEANIVAAEILMDSDEVLLYIYEYGYTAEQIGSLKGMYRVIKRNRFIFLNNSLDENMLRIVCAHELGHDQLHRNMAKTTPIHEFMLYDMKSKPEYEANIVAAEILMDSDEVLRYIYEYGYTAEQIASAMSTDINLVALKVAHLATLGYNLHALEHKSNFLK